MSDGRKIGLGVTLAAAMFAALLAQRGGFACGEKIASGPRIGDAVLIAGCP